MVNQKLDKEESRVLFDALEKTYLQDLYDLRVEQVKTDELDCFCYSVVVACIFKYQSAEQAKKIVGYFTEIMWEKYHPSFTLKLKQRYAAYQEYLSLYFSHQKTAAGLDPAMTMGFILMSFAVEKMHQNHIYVVELTTMIHKMIFACINKIKRNKMLDRGKLQLQTVN